MTQMGPSVLDLTWLFLGESLVALRSACLKFPSLGVPEVCETP
jgi:hypothetical protein